MESSQLIQPLPDLSWEDKIAYLAWKTSQQPEAKDSKDVEVHHIFHPGVYVREFKLPAGLLFFGRGHIRGHSLLLLEGSANLITEQGNRVYTAPASMATPAGFMTVAQILTDVLVRTIHPNPDELRDVSVLESMFFEPVDKLISRGQQVSQRLLT